VFEANKGNGLDNITVEVPEKVDNDTNIPEGWTVTVNPENFELEVDSKREVRLEVEVAEDEVPSTNYIEVWFWYHNETEKIGKTITVIVNQTFNLTTNPQFNLVKIHPGNNKTINLTIKNTGNDRDYFKIESTSADGITVTIDPVLTNDVASGDSIVATIDFEVQGGQNPRTERFWINTTSQEADEEGKEVMHSVTVDVEIKETYGVSFNKGEDTFTVEPTHESAGTFEFSLTVFNDGNVEDTFNFEFAMDNDTQKYKKWMTMPDSVTLDGGASTSVDFELKVNPIKSDPVAFADGILKDITIRVYSRGARDNGIEKEGDTTDEFLCHVDLAEYRYAFFTSIDPAGVIMYPYETEYINVTLKNERNGRETYAFIKDGEKGSGQNTDWYDFNVSSVEIAPLESVQVTITVSPASDAEPGIHDLEFHGKSETTYTTDTEYFRVEIKEYYKGRFVGGDTKMTDPGRSVTMRVSVSNQGNENHWFSLNSPVVPDGWGFTWTGGGNKSISPDSSKSFSAEIVLPEELYLSPAGFYSFKITGMHEIENGGEFLPNIAYFNLTVNQEYGVDALNYTVDGEGMPGDNITSTIQVQNSGNVNGTFSFTLAEYEGGNRGEGRGDRGDGEEIKDASSWVTFMDGNVSRELNIALGVISDVKVIIRIPEFSENSSEAMKGIYAFRLVAKSQDDNDRTDEMTVYFTVGEVYGVMLEAEIYWNESIIQKYRAAEVEFELTVKNLGNSFDSIQLFVPTGELSGDQEDWEVLFKSQDLEQNNLTLGLGSLGQEQITMTVKVDKNTDPGNYALMIRAKSENDSQAFSEITFFINMTKPEIEFTMVRTSTEVPSVSPQDLVTIEFPFRLTCMGNHEDFYDIEVETSTSSGPYKEWEMYFKDDLGEKRDEIIIPEDLDMPGYFGDYLQPGESVDMVLFVLVAIDEEEESYPDITISATSRSDRTKVIYLSFELTVIKPDIRVSNNVSDFYFTPTEGLEIGDSIDVFIRIFNDGDADTGAFDVFLYNGKSESNNEQSGDPIGIVRVVNIGPLNSTLIPFAWAELPAGENDIYIYADKPIRTGPNKTQVMNEFSSDGAVLESTENNNFVSIDDSLQSLIKFREIYPVDQYAVSISSSETDFRTDGKKFTLFTVTIENTGSETDEYEILVTGESKGWKTGLDSSFMITLNAGEKKVYSLSIERDNSSADVYDDESYNVTITITVRSQSYESISDSVTITGTYKDDDGGDGDDDLIPFLPPGHVIMAVGGAGLLLCFRRRRRV